MRDDFSIKGDVVDALEAVKAPGADGDVIATGLIDKVDVQEGIVLLSVLYEAGTDQNVRFALEDAMYNAVEVVDGVKDVTISPRTKGGKPAAKSVRIHGGGGQGGGDAPAHPAPRQAPHSHGPSGPTAIEGVKQVIAVASGKGGVGKSTVAVNLALALAREGFAVGILDIDVYGPSLPTLLGVQARPAVSGRRIVPLEAAGLKLMSLGFLLDDDTPVIWRGPIVTGIIRQFLQDVNWDGLDYLIIDLPPGTGDAQLSLAQTVPVDGAVVVTTPSDLALIDAARGLQMFRTLDIDVIGIVENMSYLLWPGAAAIASALEGLRAAAAPAEQLDAIQAALDEHGKLFIFGEGGGAREAARLDIPLLAQIPLDGHVRAGGDAGRPIMLSDPEGPVGAAFSALAKKVAAARPTASSSPAKGAFSFIKS